jgi:hypothetical protein
MSKRPNLPRNERNSSREVSKFTVNRQGQFKCLCELTSLRPGSNDHFVSREGVVISDHPDHALAFPRQRGLVIGHNDPGAARQDGRLMRDALRNAAQSRGARGVDGPRTTPSAGNSALAS